jgi:hypothetical protein
VLATELVSSAQYERAPRIDSLPTDRIDAGHPFFDATEFDGLRTDLDATTPFNAEVRELQALATQPSLRARQRQAAKHRVLLLGVLVVLAGASALFVAGLIRNNAASAPAAVTAPSPPSHAAGPARAVAQRAAKPSDPQPRLATAVRPQPPQPQPQPQPLATEPAGTRKPPASTPPASTPPASTPPAAHRRPVPTTPRETAAPRAASRPIADPARRTAPPGASATPNTEPKSKLITRTPSF